ncbi:MAG TPA: hypothetical protein EYP77_06530 [Anaerolineae bacterium]|nr:hypothetical protein [Anaerolineae bacterium]
MDTKSIKRLKADNPVEGVVSRYIRLRRRGKAFMGLCPFHEDKSPSFAVYPESGRWVCFGCGARGDVIDFIAGMHNVGFDEACRILAGGNLPSAKSPVSTPPAAARPVERPPEPDAAEYRALGEAVRVYHARLWSLPPDHPARRYLEQRKIDPDTIRRFAIGWCSGRDLSPAMELLRLSPSPFTTVGLLRGRREFMRGRIVIPDRTPDGTVTHMVGRSLGGDREPRYLSLPGLSRPLYGLARVQRQKPVAVVEGIFCMLSLERHGVQAVAVMGTALWGKRAAELKAVPDLYFIPQNDDPEADIGSLLNTSEVRRNKAAARWLEKLAAGGQVHLTRGQAATLRWILEIGHGRIVDLPPGIKDVNDLDQTGGMEAWLDEWAKWRER